MVSARAPARPARLRALSYPAVQAGRDYAARGAVHRLVASADGRVIKAAVQGTAAWPYVLRITLQQRRDGSAGFEGLCSCPVGFGCKHVAAALFAAQRATGGMPPLAQPVTPAPAPAEPAMPPEIADWLRQLGMVGPDDPEAYPPEIRQRVLYLVAPLTRPVGPPVLGIAATAVALRKDSSYGAGKGVQVQAGTSRYLRPSDRAILRRLDRLRYTTEGLAGDKDPAELLRRIIATASTGAKRQSGHRFTSAKAYLSAKQRPRKKGTVAALTVDRR